MTLTSYLEEDMIFQRQALKSAQQTILLMDKAKFKNSAFFSVCPITAIHYVVTDLEAESDFARNLGKNKVNLVLAK